MFCIHRIKNLSPFRFIKFSRSENNFFNQKRLVRALILFLCIVFLLSAGFNIYQWFFAEKVYYGVRLSSFPMGGKNQEEVESFLYKEVDKFLSDGFSFKALEEQSSIPVFISGVSSSDIAYSLIDYDFDEMTDSIFKYGRSGSSLKNIKDILKALIFGYEISPVFTPRDELAMSMLQEQFSHLEKSPQNATVEINFKGGEAVVQLIPDRNGTIFDYESAIKQFKENLSLFKKQEIIIAPRGVGADIKTADISVLVPSISKVFTLPSPLLDKGGIGGVEKSFKIEFNPPNTPPISLAPTKSRGPDQSVGKASKQGGQGGVTWDLPREVLADWIIFKKESDITRLGLDIEKIKEYLQKNKIDSRIEIETKNAKFVFKDDKVVEFQASTTGRKINYEKTAKSFERFFFGAAIPPSPPLDKGGIGGVVTVEIIIDIEEPQVVTGESNTLGIEELIGDGQTNFVGSPKNRVHNIKNGAKIISGLVIQPGETFSLNQSLGEISDATGFKPELVIKGDKTVPEFGGGLCQIATTLFRAAINSGLLIEERYNHSYRVSYYEPPVGMDATVYNPSPDLKFTNDTEAPILIQSKIVGTEITFEFWGAKDGREIEIGTPVVLNITKPEPTKIIETTELKPGEKKCTEHAHNGADAYFDYKVTYPNNEVIEKRFKSHYRAWQEVCLLGVKATSTQSGL